MLIDLRQTTGTGSSVLEPLSVTKNGRYTAPSGVGYSPVTVNVPSARLQEKTATENGVVIPDADYDGLSQVTVNIESNPVALDFSKAGYTQTDPAFLHLQSDLDYTVQKYNQWDPTRTTAKSLYGNDEKLIYAPAIDISNVNRTDWMFDFCSNLTSVPLLNTSNVNNMLGMFNHCRALITIPQFDTSKSIDCDSMFNNCHALTSVPQFDLSSCINCVNMFSYCSSITTVPQFDLSKVADCSYMFDDCESLTTVPTFSLSSCTKCRYMFNGCSSLTTVPAFDLSKVADCSRMFGDCTSLTSVPALDLSSCTNCFMMFFRCNSLTTVPAFNLSSCTNMNSMFSNCENLISVPSNLTTSKVEDMTGLFGSCKVLKEIGEIDCSSVKSMFSFDSNHINVTTLGGFKNLKVSLKIAGTSWNPIDKIDRQSIMNVINDLGQADPNFEANPKLTVCSKVYGYLTPEDIKIATDKGWSVISQ